MLMQRSSRGGNVSKASRGGPLGARPRRRGIREPSPAEAQEGAVFFEDKATCSSCRKLPGWVWLLCTLEHLPGATRRSFHLCLGSQVRPSSTDRPLYQVGFAGADKEGPLHIAEIALSVYGKMWNFTKASYFSLRRKEVYNLKISMRRQNATIICGL